MANTDRIKEIDVEMEKQVAIIKAGRPTYTAMDIQIARDNLTKLSREKNKLDYEARKPFIKIVKVDQPKGNSSVNSQRGKRFTVNPENTARATLNLS